MKKQKNNNLTGILKKALTLILALVTAAILWTAKYNNGTAYAENNSSETETSGIVVHIFDGDTFLLKKSDGTVIKVRMFGIDAPESTQKFGNDSKKALQSIALGKNANISIIGEDQYKRTLGVLSIDGINVNKKMLGDGNAWYYAKFCDKNFCGEWKKASTQAKKSRLGLWCDSKPMPPWKYRYEESH